ncbi:1-deoxyxylulose-5-phosphate synthase YajO-like [Littorina saxatilis]|uniref:NADP-dependent oxidoreductase domain-containing protein n=1 Tax=Littorina saxatilis TaxID=31220 RepID=A0AAN9BSG9_9CAEN
MEKRTLPGTDLQVSPLCLGCWQFNDSKSTINWEGQTRETSKAIVDKCFDVGINFFDTAEGYAGSEEVLGYCLKGRRKDAVVATKYGFRSGPSTPPYSAAEIDEAVTRSLRKMETDYIDILQIHFPSFVKDMNETLTELNSQIARGRIRHYGFSNFGPKNLKTYLDGGFKPVVNQMGYNLLWRSVEYEVQPVCAANDISILAYSPLQQGLLTGKYSCLDDIPEGRRRGKLFGNKDEKNKLARHGQEGAETEMFEAVNKLKGICERNKLDMAAASLAWVFQQEAVPVAIVGASTPEQIERNSKIIKLSPEILKEMSDATQPVKDKIGKQLDQWATPDRCE